MHRELKPLRWDARLFTRVRRHYGSAMIMNMIYLDAVVTTALIVWLAVT